MPTALTGSMGWSGAHPFQLGGPPLLSNYSRPLPSQALPLIAHAYANDGVTFVTTFAPLNRPSIRSTLTNGGQEQVTLEVSATGTSLGLALGNVVRLTEDKGPYAGFIYGGIVESFPDTRSATGTKHEIVLTPFGAELTRVASTFVYSASVDVAQIVRDAVSLTQHCSCDQVSVPTSTGILAVTSASGGSLDFRNQKLNQVLDTTRSIAGPGWFWHCDELGRVWFQPQGSGAVYTLMGGQHYTERVSNGGDIQNRVNQVAAVGGVPTGGSLNVTAVANGASQSTIGVRALDPPIQVPNVSDQATLTAIAAGILGTLDVTWTRFSAKVLPSLGVRIHGSQPGGAMIRYWEPAVNPMSESATGTGTYTGPYIGQTVEYDGLLQAVEAGNQPITSQTDIDNMVRSWAERAAAISLQITAAALNLKQTLTGTFQSSPGTVTPSGLAAALWSLSQTEFAAIDPNGVTRAEMGNLGALGVSPAQWGLRAIDASGNPIFDSLGVVGLPKLLAEQIQTTAVQGTNASLADVSGSVTASFSLSRTANVVVMAMGTAAAQASAGNTALLGLRVGALQTTGTPGRVDGNVNGFTTYCLFFRAQLAAGSYTAALQASVNAGQWNVGYVAVDVWQFGG